MMSGMNIDLTLLREELEGCLSLGMEREAVRLAGRILRANQLDAVTFNSTVNALLISEDRLGRWLVRVESAFGSLKRRDQRKAATMMFNFHVSMNRWEAAARFMPRRPATAMELLFSVWTLLNLKKVQEAGDLLKLNTRRFRKSDSDFDQSCLMEATACYAAQDGNWEAAELVCERSTGFWPFAPNAWERLVKIHALRGLLKANEVFDFVRVERDRTDSRVSPNAKAPCPPERLHELDVDFHRHAKHLAKVIPARERWRFGL